MKWIIAGLIITGIAAAFCAAMLVASMNLEGTGAVAMEASTPGEIEVLIATRELPAMSIVDATAVTTRVVAAEEVAEDSRLHYTQIVGQVLVAPLVEGAVFRDQHFASRDSGVHLAATLPEGRRAMSAMLADDSGIIDLLYPGCLVDVIGSFRLPSSRNVASGEVLSATLIQGVQVLAIGPRSIVTSNEESDGESLPATIDRKQRRRVTFMVDNDQAETLQLAMAHGEITVAMRNPLDVGTSDGQGVLLTDLSGSLSTRLARMTAPGDSGQPMATSARTEEGEPAAAAPAPEASAVWTTIVMRGLDAETKTFPIDDDKN